MVQIQLINMVVEWQRKLDIEEERRENHRSDPYVNYLAAPQPRQKVRQIRAKEIISADFLKALNPNLY